MESEKREGRDHFLGNKQGLPDKKITIEAPDDYCRVENWYNDIEDITFKTELFDIDLETGNEICKCRNTIQYIQRLIRAYEINRNLRKLKELNLETPKEMLNIPLSPILVKLRNKIDKYLSSPEFGGCAFVKLSSRSPKDAILNSEKIKVIIDEELEKLSNNDDSDKEWETKAAIAFTRGCTLGLKCSSGEEAISFLTNSRRVYEDIANLKLLHGEENFTLKVILRKWEEIAPEWEFRAFIVNDEMTCITQYYKLCYVPEIAAKKKMIGKKIKKFFDKIKKPIKITNYTIDFVLSPKNDKIWIIEINHPPPSAGTILFDWKNNDDWKVLREGPFEIRVVEDHVKNPLAEIHQPVRHYLLRKRYIHHHPTYTNICEDPKLIHQNYGCDICHVYPINGPRYQCKNCSPSILQSFDICSICYGRDRGEHGDHKFIRFGDNENGEEENDKKEGGCVVM